jgi:hypothetical protein
LSRASFVKKLLSLLKIPRGKVRVCPCCGDYDTAPRRL